MSLENKKIACPMDCYDACQAQIVDENIKGSKENLVTNGKLCVNFANLLNEKNLQTAFYENKEISLDESLNMLVEKLKLTTPVKTLFFKGSGNIGVMQNSTKNFFTQYGSNLTRGSLCDGGGNIGIEEGRGVVINPPIQNETAGKYSFQVAKTISLGFNLSLLIVSSLRISSSALGVARTANTVDVTILTKPIPVRISGLCLCINVFATLTVFCNLFTLMLLSFIYFSLI